MSLSMGSDLLRFYRSGKDANILVEEQGVHGLRIGAPEKIATSRARPTEVKLPLTEAR
jgi:hypothetical protein